MRPKVHRSSRSHFGALGRVSKPPILNERVTMYTCHFSLVGGVALACALAAPVSAQSLYKQHQMVSATAFCCSGSVGFYYSPWVATDGTLTNPVWWSQATINSSVAPGSFEGAIQLEAWSQYGVHVRGLWGEIWNVSSDVLTPQSTALPVGTGVTIRMTGYVDGNWDTTGRSILMSGGSLWAESSASNPGPKVAVSVRNDLSVGVGWSFDTQYRMFAGGYLDRVMDGVTWGSLVSGNAHMTIEVLTPGVTLSSASGFNYAPVPEPGTWALWIAGLVATGFVRRRRSVSIGSSA